MESRSQESVSLYSEYETTEAWKIIDAAISDLVANQDIKETTPRHYIVGYLVKSLVDSSVLSVGRA